MRERIRLLNLLLIAFGFALAASATAHASFAKPYYEQYEYLHPDGNVYDVYVIRYWQTGGKDAGFLHELSQAAHRWTREFFRKEYPQHAEHLKGDGFPSKEEEARSTHFIVTEHGNPKSIRATFRTVLEKSGTRALPIDAIPELKKAGWKRPTLDLRRATTEDPYVYFGENETLSSGRKNRKLNLLVKHHVYGDVFHGGAAQLTEIAADGISIMPIHHFLLEQEAEAVAEGYKDYREGAKNFPDRYSLLSREYPIKHKFHGVPVPDGRGSSWAYPMYSFPKDPYFFEARPYYSLGVAISEWTLYCPSEKESYYESLGFRRFGQVPEGAALIPMRATRSGLTEAAARTWKDSRVRGSLTAGRLDRVNSAYDRDEKPGDYRIHWSIARSNRLILPADGPATLKSYHDYVRRGRHR